MREPAISVIVPIYKVEAWLPRCMESLLNQDLDDLEIILVDDGSPDGCPALCDRYAEQDSRVRVIHKKNEGLGMARNTGLAAARGTYVSFIDSDDWLRERAYSRLKPFMDAGADVIRFGFDKVKDGKTVKTDLPCYETGLYRGEDAEKIRLDVISNELALDYGRTRILSAWSKLFRRELLTENGIVFQSEREILNEDYLFDVQVMQRAESVGVLHEALYCYDTREGSITCAARPRMLERKRALYDAYAASVDSSDPEVQRRLRNFYIDCFYASAVDQIRTVPAGKAVPAIRQILRDQPLKEAIRRSRDSRDGKKTRIIRFLMEHECALSMYWGYRLMMK